MRCETAGGDLSVSQEGHAGDEDVVGEGAAVGVFGRPGAIVTEDVRENRACRRGRLDGRITVPLEDFRPWPQVFRHVVGRMSGVVLVLGVVRVDELGIPDPAVIKTPRALGTFVVQTITSADEARQPADAGVDALAVQSSAAGGHSGTFKVVTTHPAEEIVALDTGLGIERSEQLVVIHVVSRRRTQAQKQKLYALLARNLRRDCALAPADPIVSITENDDEDWSFGHGRAQFLTGELV
jgi:hypothetical protein